MRSAQNIDQRITQNNFQIYNFRVGNYLGRSFAWSCQEFGMPELASFPESSRQRALQRFHLLRAHLEDGLVACCDCSRSKHLLSNTAVLAVARTDFLSGGPLAHGR